MSQPSSRNEYALSEEEKREGARARSGGDWRGKKREGGEGEIGR